MFVPRYSIDFEDVLKECASSSDFFKRLKSGRYLYVGSCLCLNSPEYIRWNENGTAELTEYAHEHQDECCLRFVVTITGGWASGHDSDEPVFGYMTSPTVSRPRYLENKEQIKKQIAMFSKVRAETKEIAKDLSPNLSVTVKKLMKWRHMTVEQLAEASEMSEKTIQRLRKDPPEIEATMESLMQFCIGLHLPPTLSGHVLQAAGKSFTGSDLHIAYQILLASCYEYSIEECNTLLKGQGLPPLGNAAKTA